MDLKKLKIGVLMGGLSSEREISLRSGKNVFQVFKENGYHVVQIDVNEDFINVVNKEKIDVAFNVLHGYFGEDGRVQSILDFLKIPYTGSGVEASTIGMNKILAKQMAILAGINTLPFFFIRDHEDFKNIDFNFPWIIKPSNEGSSIGVKVINSKDELNQIDFTINQYLVEPFIKGVEVTSGILDNGIEILKLPVLELVPKNNFYDFEAKYTTGMTEFILPARLDKENYETVQNNALLMHKITGCKGATRSDFIVNDDGTFFLEINTNPGMTETSDIPAQARSYGLTDLELCLKILESAFCGGKN